MVLADFLSYLKKERGFSVHTVQAYENDLNRFILYIRFKDKYGDEEKWEEKLQKIMKKGATLEEIKTELNRILKIGRASCRERV